MTNLKLFCCYRENYSDESWVGALLILAENKESAQKIFISKEDNKPESIYEYPNIFGSGKEEIIYNDDMR